MLLTVIGAFYKLSLTLQHLTSQLG